MNFIEYKPRKTNSTKETIEKIRVSFTKLKNKKGNPICALKIYIGKKIADQVGYTNRDRITFSYNPENNKIWLLKKSIDGSGFTLGKQNEFTFILQITWDVFKPEDKNFSIREVKHDIYEGGIRIYYS